MEHLTTSEEVVAVEEKSRAEAFIEKASNDTGAFRDTLRGDGSFDYIKQVSELQNLSNKLSQNIMVYLFGDRIGKHLFEKFVLQHNRNLLSFLSNIENNHSFFILYELKHNPNLFYH